MHIDATCHIMKTPGHLIVNLQLLVGGFVLEQGSSINVSLCLDWVIILQVETGYFQICVQLVVYIVLPGQKQGRTE